MDIKALELSLQNLRPSANDDPELQAYLETIKNYSLPFANLYKSSWLISDFGDMEWVTKTETSYLDKQGCWKRTKIISWNLSLPNGFHLTDSRYRKLLEACKKIVFLHRQGLATNNAPPAMTVWLDFINNVLCLAQWLVLKAERYEPEKFAFLLLDQCGIDELTHKLATGGWNEALEVPKRIISFLYESSIGEKCPSNYLKYPFDLPHEKIQSIIQWVKIQGGYLNSYRAERGLINRKFLANKIHAQPSALTSQKLSAALRKFEPLLFDPVLLLKGNQTNEFPSHRTPTVTEIIEKTQTKSSFNRNSGALVSLFNLYRHIPDCIPSPSLINLTRPRKSALHLCSEAGHTPFIPTKIAFSYLNSALFLINIGDDLISYYLQIMKKLISKSNNSKDNGCKFYWKDTVSRFSVNILQSTPLPETLKLNGFDFKKFTKSKHHSWSFEHFRESPSLTEALEIWVGAVVIAIGLLKPSRDLEICSLSHNCLLKDENGNYWLDSILAKNTVAEYHTTTGGKPIPLITAKAIQQMNTLGNELKILFDEKESYNLQRLFYLPNINRPGTCKDINNESLNYYLDKFSDYVGLPADKLGRRWYIRIHEMRKWFLLMFFWAGRYDVLDAARSVAGHNNVEHIYSYIKREFPSDQLGELESEWVIDQLVNLESNNIDSSVDGLVELRNKILKDFKAINLNCIEERQWHHYVEVLFEQEYHIEVFTLSTNISDVCIAIRSGKAEKNGR